MIKKFIIIQFIVAIIAAWASTLSASANENDFSITVRGGLGVGKTIYGFSEKSSNAANAGIGSGGGIILGGMVSYSMFAFDLDLAFATLGDIEWNEDVDEDGIKERYNHKGQGSMWFFDPKIGLKLFTEENDMGYSLFFGGVRIAGVSYDSDSITKTVNGVSTDYGSQKTSAACAGWIAGFRDYSTFSLDSGTYSLVTLISAWIDSAPVDEYKVNGRTYKAENSKGSGLGGEAGIGIADEQEGLSVILSYRFDLLGSEFNNINTDAHEGFGFGYGLFMLGATMEF